MDLDDNNNTINNDAKGEDTEKTSAKKQHAAHNHNADDDIVQLRHLASEAAHTTYTDLQLLLKSKLPSANNEQRRQHIFDFVVRSRLLLARLLGATRWAATYANAATDANRVEEQSIQRINTLDDTADDLWAARRRVLHNVRPPVQIQHALNVLANGTDEMSFPQVVRSAAGINKINNNQPVDDGGDGDVVMEGDTTSTQQLSPHARISLATRRALRDALPAVPRVKVLDWNAPPACVRVGIPNLWSADLMLDALDINAAYGLNGKSANFRCFRISLLLNADPDAPTSTTPPSSAPNGNNNGTGTTSAVPAGLSNKEESMLCRLADDRMAHAAAAAAALSISTASPTQSSGYSNHNQPQLDRAQVMLGDLCDLLTTEVCAPLVMAHLRSQAEALKNGPWAAVLQVSGSAVDSARNTPIVLKYWNSYRTPASITISEYQRKTSTASASHTQLVVVTHDPPLPPGCAGNHNFPALIEDNTKYLNLESILISCVRIRSGERLLGIAEAVLRRRKELAVHSRCLTLRTSCRENEHRIRPLGTNLDLSQVGYESLVIHLHQDRCLGIEVRIHTRNGGLRVRTFGAANLVVPSRKEPDGNAWKGDRFIKSSEEEERIVCTIVKTVRGCVKLDCAARAVCALDIGVSNTLPPGTASVAATAPAERSASQLVPPFAPLERRSPRRFLTLSPPPITAEQVKGVANSFVTALPPKTRNCLSREGSHSKRPRLTYATTSDALVFIQESSVVGDDRCPLDKAAEKPQKRRRCASVSADPLRPSASDMDDVDRYNGTAAAAAAWAVTRDVVERRLRRDSLLRAFVAANVASAAHTHHTKSGDDGALHLESASRVLLKVKCEPLPVRRAELLLRGSDAWQVRLSLLPPIFDSTDAALGQKNTTSTLPNGIASNNNTERINAPSNSKVQRMRDGGGDGNLWTVGVACGGSQLTFTYPSANAASVRSFFRDLTRARTAAALARGVPPSPFYRVLRRSPVRIVVGVGPFHSSNQEANGTTIANRNVAKKHSYTATVEYVYSEGNSGGFSLKFTPTKPTMELLAPLIEEALDASGGQVGGILAGLLERACPVAAAAESAVRERGLGRIRFVTALRVRAVFAGVEQGSGETPAGSDGRDGTADKAQRNRPPPGQVPHAVDVDARGGGGVVTVIDVGRATSVMIQQGFANRGGSSHSNGDREQRNGNSNGGNSNNNSTSSGRRDFVLVPKWDDIVAQFCRDGHAEAQRAGSTVVLRMSQLERFLTALVASVRPQGTNGTGRAHTGRANGPTNANMGTQNTGSSNAAAVGTPQSIMTNNGNGVANANANVNAAAMLAATVEAGNNSNNNVNVNNNGPSTATVAAAMTANATTT